MSTPGSPGATSSVARTTMRIASTWSTTPARRAVIAAPESRATISSMPVPTNGASARSSGTAWRCMFEPISARFASSFSRNGISEAATETSCFGETSIRSTFAGGFSMKSPPLRVETRSFTKRPSSSRLAFAWAMVWRISSVADMYCTSSVTWPSLTWR